MPGCPLREIAEQVALTSPAVSSRIHKLETDGIISGYTVVLNRPADRVMWTRSSACPSHPATGTQAGGADAEQQRCCSATMSPVPTPSPHQVSCGSMPSWST